MTAGTMQRLLSKRPFVPFRIISSSGERHEVRHPEMVWLTRSTLYIGEDPDAEGIPADAAWVSLLHINAVEPLTNGRPRRGPRRKTKK